MESRCCSLAEAKHEEEKALKACKGQKWTDPSFPASSSSLMRRDRSLAHDVEWARLSEVLEHPSLFVDGVESGDVIQGELGDCWFLGAMSVVATRKDLMYPLFVSAHPQQAIYQIKFYLNGAWRVVTVDDYIPFKHLRSRLFKFAHCKDPNEMWVPLMEKAFAKLCGCYEYVASGNFSEGMTNLTGEGCDDQKTSRDAVFWDKLQYYDSESFLMGCSIKGSGERDNGRGLLIGHAYGILRCVVTSNSKRLIQIRNPWGQKEWTGAFSDGSREMTPALLRELGHVNADDGTFWMTFEDFSANFDSFAVCRLLTDEIGKVWEKRMFVDHFSGGCSNHSTWTRNPQFWISIKGRPVEVFVHLAQDDTRTQGSAQCKESIGFYVWYCDDASQKKSSRTANDTLHTPTFINSREYSFAAKLGAGTYLIMPCTFSASCSGRYFLTVYSEDPVETGKVGQGPAPKLQSKPPDLKSINWLNRPGAPPPPVPRRPHAPHIVTPPPPVPSRAQSPRAHPSSSHSNSRSSPTPSYPSAVSPRSTPSSHSTHSSHSSSNAPSRTVTTTETTTTVGPGGVKKTTTVRTTIEPPPPSSHARSEPRSEPRPSPPPPAASHSSSVMCKRCLRSIKSGETYVTRNGKTYCNKHAYEKCKGCKKDLKGGQIISVPDGLFTKKFHTGCFKCQRCRTQLSGSFYKSNGKICCQRCASK